MYLEQNHAAPLGPLEGHTTCLTVGTHNNTHTQANARELMAVFLYTVNLMFTVGTLC